MIGVEVGADTMIAVLSSIDMPPNLPEEEEIPVIDTAVASLIIMRFSIPPVAVKPLIAMFVEPTGGIFWMFSMRTGVCEA